MNTQSGKILKSMFLVNIELYIEYLREVSVRLPDSLSLEDRHLFYQFKNTVNKTVILKNRGVIRYTMQRHYIIASNLLKKEHFSEYLELCRLLTASLDVYLAALDIKDRKRIEDIDDIEILSDEGNTLLIYPN